MFWKNIIFPIERLGSLFGTDDLPHWEHVWCFDWLAEEKRRGQSVIAWWRHLLQRTIASGYTWRGQQPGVPVDDVSVLFCSALFCSVLFSSLLFLFFFLCSVKWRNKVVSHVRDWYILKLIILFVSAAVKKIVNRTKLQFFLCSSIKNSNQYCIIPLCWVTLAPPPRKNRSGGTNPTNQSSQSWLFVSQSINRKAYSESLRLIDWFCTFPGKLPYGYNFRVKSDST